MALFVGPGTPLAPPWESVCRHKDEALVFQKETLEVRAAYQELGLQVEKLHHEPDDHIAYELEFFAAAVWQAAEAAKAGGAGRAAKAQAVVARLPGATSCPVGLHLGRPGSGARKDRFLPRCSP